MPKSSNFAITLTIIYLALVAVCIAIYHLIIRFIPTHDYQSLAVDLLSWSATLFATIALLYTFNLWKYQKRYELAHSISSDIYTKSRNFHDELSNLIIGIHFMYKMKRTNESVRKLEDLIALYHDDLSESYTKLNYLLNDKSLSDKFMKLLDSLCDLSDFLTLAQRAYCIDLEARLFYEKLYNNKLQETFNKEYQQLEFLMKNFTDCENMYRKTLLKISLYEKI